jgi:hypothetical protein
MLQDLPFNLRLSSNAHARQEAKSIQILSRRRESSGDLNIKPRVRRDLLDVPCTYHKGARHTHRGCRLWKKIDWECDASHSVWTPTSPDIAEFQKPRIRVSPNDQRSIRRRVLVVSANEPPQVGVTDSEEAHHIQGNANHA